MRGSSGSMQERTAISSRLIPPRRDRRRAGAFICDETRFHIRLERTLRAALGTRPSGAPPETPRTSHAHSRLRENATLRRSFPLPWLIIESSVLDANGSTNHVHTIKSVGQLPLGSCRRSHIQNWRSKHDLRVDA